MVTTELKPGGAFIRLMEENKQEYVDLVVDYRISKRVKDQSDALMSGLSDLIPLDLITVFDERELELLIVGIPEINVYVPFTRYILPIFFLPVLFCTVTTGSSLQTTEGIHPTMKLSNGSGNACEAGHQNGNLACCSSRLGHRVFHLVGCKDRMDRDGLRSKSQAIRCSCRLVMLAFTGLICHLTRTMPV